MLLQLHPDATSFFATLSPKRAAVYAGAVLVVLAFISMLLWRLPIYAYFRKPIESDHQCPHCGSRDIRASHLSTAMDSVRRRVGLQPFRCRGCTRRFISRSKAETHSRLGSEAEAN